MYSLLHNLFRAIVLAVLFACAATGAAETVSKPVDLNPVPAINRASQLPEGWQHGAFMEIFVRAYKDSNGDGIGDLRGLTSKLDYLRDLGIRGIWLMPITASADRDHGYATTDFRALERDYGTMADFDEFIKQAHRRGIGVIIDYVVNHSAATHPLFAESRSGTANKYRDWYVWQETAPKGWDIWGKDPWTQTPQGAYFGTFGPHMPDFNLRRPEVVEYHKDSLRFWLNRGLDGFRLDAVPHLIENDAVEWNDQPQSRALTNELQQLIKSYSRSYVVCEATAKPQAYAVPDVCGSAFAFTHERNLIGAAKGDPEAMKKAADYFNTAPVTMATFLSNHDIFAGERLWDQLQGNEKQYKLAAATYLLQPGTPFIYYGEEIGMGGVKSLAGDQPLRAPMSWNAQGGFTSGNPFRPVSPNAAKYNVSAQSKDPNSILSFYKAMLKLRNAYPSIARGSYESAFVEGSVIGFQRKFSDGKKNEHAMVLINYGTLKSDAAVSGLQSGASFKKVFPRDGGAVAVDANGVARVTIPPQSVVVLVRSR